MNLYAYVNGDPVNMADVTGMWGDTIIRLRAYPLGSVLGIPYGHAFVEITSTTSRDDFIARGGPSIGGVESWRSLFSGVQGDHLVGGVDRARDSTDYRQPGTQTLMTLTIHGDVVQNLIVNIKIYDSILNSSNIQYIPWSVSSNTYASAIIKLLTGDLAFNNSNIVLPGLEDEQALPSTHIKGHK